MFIIGLIRGWLVGREGLKQVHIVSMESFYRRLTDEQRQAALRGKYNFDHPGKLRCLLEA